MQARVAEWLAEWIEPDLSEDLQLWELGAGTGFFTQKLCACGLRVLATDIAPEMVARGRNACPQAQWIIHDSWQLPESVCDRLYSSSLLQWAPAFPEVLIRLRRALRAGGKMLHGFFIAPSLCEFYSLASKYGALPVAWRTENAWLDAFSEAGLKILKSETLKIEVFYPSAFAFAKMLHNSGTTAPAGTFSPRVLREVLRDYDKQFAVPESDSGTSVRATWAFMRLEAEKM